MILSKLRFLHIQIDIIQKFNLCRYLTSLTQLKFVNTVGINIYCEVCKNWLLQKYLVPNQLLRGQDLLSCPESPHTEHFTLL